MLWLQRRREIEAINGAWAMIGLTAGLVIEGQTGKSILTQVYLFFSVFVRMYVPSSIFAIYVYFSYNFFFFNLFIFL